MSDKTILVIGTYDTKDDEHDENNRANKQIKNRKQ